MASDQSASTKIFSSLPTTSGALGLAGIMGGADSAVSVDSTDIYLECAWFAPEVISGRGRRLGIQTDASYRFERGVDPRGQHRAMQRATALLLEIAGGEPGPVDETSSRRTSAGGAERGPAAPASATAAGY
ncbi:MAG: phenylalanine--tRNA ligase beta subunit-related protein [Gammaproteobacteria bacterium]|nr:phenylalanine--tRNA ligase beta subunit-related protein [Gammaproteobacteria bacterium]